MKRWGSFIAGYLFGIVVAGFIIMLAIVQLPQYTPFEISLAVLAVGVVLSAVFNFVRWLYLRDIS